MRLVVVVIAGCASALLMAGQGHTGDEARLTIEHGGNTISVEGTISSAAHESILQRTLEDRFPGHEKALHLVVRPALPPGWALITDVTLKAVAETRSAAVDIAPDRIGIRGFSADAERWAAAYDRISDSLLPGMQLDTSVVAVGPPVPLGRQCVRLFRTALRGRHIEFPQSSAELGTNAAPLLDELVQIASDCPGAHVEIVGHADGSGDESTNRALSRARADAVADYMIRAGLPASRIDARGAGAAEPRVDETGPQSRRINRRIEVGLRFP
jgi:OOP family OmpA-OmpF porin